MRRVDFFSRVNKDGPNECWLWEGPKDHHGYGKYGRYGTAHRWSYEYHKGSIPEGLQIDHLCRVRNCVNPAHLEAVTKKENTLRGQTVTGINSRKTHCPKGHPYDQENTQIEFCHGGVGRICKICKREKAKQYRKNRREERIRNVV